MTTLLDLPDEILSEIFTHLSTGVDAWHLGLANKRLFSVYDTPGDHLRRAIRNTEVETVSLLLKKKIPITREMIELALSSSSKFVALMVMKSCSLSLPLIFLENVLADKSNPGLIIPCLRLSSEIVEDMIGQQKFNSHYDAVLKQISGNALFQCSLASLNLNIGNYAVNQPDFSIKQITLCQNDLLKLLNKAPKNYLSFFFKHFNITVWAGYNIISAELMSALNDCTSEQQEIIGKDKINQVRTKFSNAKLPAFRFYPAEAPTLHNRFGFFNRPQERPQEQNLELNLPHLRM